MHGSIDIPGCPKAYAVDAWPMIRAFNWMENHGLPPVAGGWMEQSQQFLDGIDFVRSEKAAAVASRNK